MTPSRCEADGRAQKAIIPSASFFAALNPVALKLNRALGRVQGRDDVGRAGFHRDTCESDGLVSRLQLEGRGMRDGNALQRHARTWQAVSGVQAQRLGGIWLAPLNQAWKRAVEQALPIFTHSDLPLHQATA